MIFFYFLFFFTNVYAMNSHESLNQETTLTKEFIRLVEILDESYMW